jgi:hypothetical protein
MNEKTKLILALHQVENLTKLLDDNEYQNFICYHLIQIQVELKRQLSHYATRTN